MAIPDEDVAQVRSATDILAVIGEYTPLKRVGRRYQGLCPFHAEKSASFSVNAEEGLYYCFGCGASGDAITFLRSIEGCDFVEAVEKLAARAGITIRHDAGGKDSFDREGRQALLGVMERAVAFYHEELLIHPDGRRARQYLRSRGYEGDTVRQFSLGWAPEGGGSLVRAVRAPADLLEKAGLAHRGQSGLRDAFRGRVIFPIFDPMGKAIGLGGRVLPGAGEGAGPKYRNSPETPIYSKRRTLYGLNWAKQAVVQANEVIICEGYTDVIGFFAAGLPRAVATCGTSLTEEHFRLLGRFAKRVVLAFDADAAGQAAAARIYDWEKRHELEVAVAALPQGSDPGDLAMRDPQLLREAVERARTFLSFRVERALASSELQTGEGRAHAAEAALAMVAEHPNELVRDQYLVTVSDRTRLEVERLRPRLDGLVRAFKAVEPQDRRRRHQARRRGRAAVAIGRRAPVGAGSRGQRGRVRPRRAIGRARFEASQPALTRGTWRAGRPGCTRALDSRAGRHGRPCQPGPVRRSRPARRVRGALRARRTSTTPSRALTTRSRTCFADSPSPSPTPTRTRP